MPLNYAVEKFGEAVYVLGTAPGRIQERLRAVDSETPVLNLPAKNDIPAELRDDYEAILCGASAWPREPGSGALCATSDAMSDGAAVTLARRIVDLEVSLRERHDEALRRSAATARRSRRHRS